MNYNSLEDRYKDPDFWTAKLQLQLYRMIKQHLEDEGISQNEFSRRLGVSKGYISQVLNGNFDHKLSKLVSLSLATGKVPSISYPTIQQHVQKAKGDYPGPSITYVSQAQAISFEDTAQPIEKSALPSTTTDVIFKHVA